MVLILHFLESFWLFYYGDRGQHRIQVAVGHYSFFKQMEKTEALNYFSIVFLRQWIHRILSLIDIKPLKVLEETTKLQSIREVASFRGAQTWF